jgi:hypothetical protein
VQLCDLSCLGKICRSTHQLGEDANNNKLDDMIHAAMPDQFIFLQFAVGYSFIHAMDLPELQIDEILRHMREEDNQESAPSQSHT